MDFSQHTCDGFYIARAMTLAIAAVQALPYASETGLFSAQFPAEFRFAGISLGVQASAAIGGDIGPVVATYLLAPGSGQSTYVVVYLLFLGLITLTSAEAMRSPYQH